MTTKCSENIAEVQCQKCDANFKCKCSLLQHTRQHCPGSKSNTPYSFSLKKSSRWCGTCAQMFASEGDLEQHKAYVHSSNVGKGNGSSNQIRESDSEHSVSKEDSKDTIPGSLKAELIETSLFLRESTNMDNRNTPILLNQNLTVKQPVVKQEPMESGLNEPLKQSIKIEDENMATQGENESSCQTASKQLQIEKITSVHIKQETEIEFSSEFWKKSKSKTPFVSKNGGKQTKRYNMIPEARVCRLCHKTFSKRHLGKHIWNKCDKALVRNQILSEHSYGKRRDRNQVKRQIPQPEASLSDWLTDKAECSWTISFKCTVCNKACVSHTSLVRHMRKVHIGQEIYRCSICLKQFSVRESLRQHVTIHVPNRGLSMLQRARNALAQSQHKTNALGVLLPRLYAKLLRCTQCNFQCKSSSGLKKHMLSGHSKPSSSGKIQSKKKQLRKFSSRRKGSLSKAKKMLKRNRKINFHKRKTFTGLKKCSKLRPYSRCVMCLHWYRGIKEHLRKCQAKRPCLNRITEMATHIKNEPLDSTNYTNVLCSIVVQPAEQAGELLLNSIEPTGSKESELKSLMQQPGININHGLNSSCDRSSSGKSLFCDDLEAEVRAEEKQREHHNVLERKRRKNVKEMFITLKNKIPELQALERVPRVMILNKAAEYVKGLQVQEQQLMIELEKQRRINEYLLFRGHV